MYHVNWPGGTLCGTLCNIVWYLCHSVVCFDKEDLFIQAVDTASLSLVGQPDSLTPQTYGRSHYSNITATQAARCIPV